MRLSIFATALLCGVAMSATAFAQTGNNTSTGTAAAPVAPPAGTAPEAQRPAAPAEAQAPAMPTPPPAPDASAPPAAPDASAPPAAPDASTPPPPPSSDESATPPSDQGSSSGDSASSGSDKSSSHMAKKPMHHASGTSSRGASNISESDTHGEVAPKLPSPDVGANGSAKDYLKAAAKALRGHRTGEAQQALEMAETRALESGGVTSNPDSPVSNPMVSKIDDALKALGKKDMQGARSAIHDAMGGGSMDDDMSSGKGNMHHGMHGMHGDMSHGSTMDHSGMKASDSSGSGDMSNGGTDAPGQ
jgi:hypothetical protein